MFLGWRSYTDGAEVATGGDVVAADEVLDGADFVWIRVSDPTPDEVHELARAFDLPELAVEDSLHAHQRPKLDIYHDVAFMVLKPAVYDDARETITLGELHAFVGPRYALTIRHGDVGELDEVALRLERQRELCALGPAAVLHAVADQTVDDYEPVVRALALDIDEIERDVFDVERQPATERIYGLMREVIDFHRATDSLLRPLEDLAAGRIGLVPDGLAHHFRDVADHARKTTESVDGFRELLQGALQANVALIGLQENRDQRKMSAWAAIALVPTILAGIWGMNFQHMPLLQTDFGYAVGLAIMAAVAGYLYWRLRRSGWM